MLHNFVTTYWPIGPEIVLAVGAMALLMYGAMRPETESEAELVGWLAIFVMFLAGWLVLRQPAETVSLFERAFIVDGFARFMKLLVLIASAGALILSFDHMKQGKYLKFEFPVLVLLATTGMMMMISAGDLISLYLGLELQSLALYVVAAFHRDDVKSSEAGLKYFVLGALSSGMLLYGASFIYGFAGTTSFVGIAEAAKATDAAANIGLVFGLVFLLVGLAFKISAVPFHMWTPDVYEGAPTPVTAFFAAAPKAAAFALLTRVVISAFGAMKPQWQQVIIALSIASMGLGAFAAIGQTNIKRLLAYSSIANMGFALVGLAAGTADGTQGVLVYLAIYLAMTLGAFACVVSMRRDGGPVEDMNELAGLSKTSPGMAWALAFLMFSLAGIPPLAGFWGKFYVFLAAVNAQLWPLAVLGVIASVIGAYYYLRIIKLMFFDDAKPAFHAVDWRAGSVMVAATAFVLLFVLWPAPLIDGARAAAKSLF